VSTREILREDRATALLLSFGIFVAALTAQGQTLEVLHSFEGSDGWRPGGLVQASNGDFYGITARGGAFNRGTVFKITTNGALTVLVSFDQTNGSYSEEYNVPPGLVQGSDGNFYGTTIYGGDLSLWGGWGAGTVFRMTPDGILTTLVRFNINNGMRPLGGMIQGDDGNFYGTTSQGGDVALNPPWGYGTVFRMTSEGELTMLGQFDNTHNGFSPQWLTQGSDGDFYGFNYLRTDGPFQGYIFRMTPSCSLVIWISRPDWWVPGPLVRGANGDLFGTTSFGGVSSSGRVFKITPAGVLATVISFGTNSAGPGLVLGRDGNF